MLLLVSDYSVYEKYTQMMTVKVECDKPKYIFPSDSLV